MVVLDTNIVIDTLRQRTGETVLQKILGAISKTELAISMITIQELYQGKSTADLEKEKHLQALITPLRILPYSYDIAKLAGEIVRDGTKLISFSDAAVAATAIVFNGKLATLNRDDFKNIPDLELINL